MLEWLGHLYAVLAVVPFVPFIIVWAIVYYRRKDKRQATLMSMDVTTALLIAVVASMFNNVFSSKFGFYGILLFFLIAGGLMGNLQYRVRGKLNVAKIFRSLWRISFFAMSLLYVVFLFVGIGKNIFTM